MRRAGQIICVMTKRAKLLIGATSAAIAFPAEALETGPSNIPLEAPIVRKKQVDEIIVTARRRPEQLQRTPSSVIALSGRDLESRSVTNLRSLQNFVPNLTFAPSQNVGEAAANVFIRGIGQEDFGVGAEAGVGFYVDGVYSARSLGMIANLLDVERIEVLRGPQGTLFGKDTIGGAINLISVAPQPAKERRASFIVGTGRRAELQTVLNEPVSGALLLRFAFSIVSRDGYLRRVALPAGTRHAVERANGRKFDLRPEGDDRSQGARLQLRWLVSDTLTADFTVDGSRRRNTQGAIRLDLIDPRFGLFPDINQEIDEGDLPGPEISNDLVPRDFFESYATGNNFTDQDFWGASVVISKLLRANTLKFIGAYRALRSHIGTDDDGLYFDVSTTDIRVKQHQLSGELMLNGETGRTTYTAGLFALHERPAILPTSADTDVLYTCGCSPGDLPILTTVKRDLSGQTISGYAQGTYRLTDRISATLGARYSHETKRLDGAEYLLDAELEATESLVASGHARDSWGSFTFRADAQYQAADDLLVYGSVAQGFKSGGFNVRGNPDRPNMGFDSFRPETALTYELGFRSEWFRRKLRLNATLFNTEYHDIQLRQQAIIDGQFDTLIQNAGKARIRGAEIELAAVPFEGLMLSAAYGHLDPKYLDVGTVRGLSLDSQFQRSPRHSFTVSGDYELPFPSATVELHADYGYRTKEQFQILPAVNDQQGFGLLSARITLRPRNRRWAVAVLGTNLTNEHYRTAGRGTLIRTAGFSYSSIGMPRQFAVEFTKNF